MRLNIVNKPERLVYDFVYSLWVLGEKSIIDEYVPENSIVESAVGLYFGPDGKRKYFDAVNNAFLYKASINKIMSYGSHVSVKYALSAMHVGKFCGVLPTNKHFNFAGNILCDVVDNQIVTCRNSSTLVNEFARKGLKLNLPRPNIKVNYHILLNAARYVHNIRLDNNEVAVFALKVCGFTLEHIANVLKIPYTTIKLIIMQALDKLGVKENEFIDLIIHEGTVELFLKIAKCLKGLH